MSPIVIYSNTHTLHKPKYEIFEGKRVSHADKPERLINILTEIKKINWIKIINPDKFSEEYILKLHQKQYIEFIKNKSANIKKGQEIFPSYFIMDTYTPINSGTYLAAISALEVALTGAKLLTSDNTLIYSLCRPPGHHAEYKNMGGYCYFNNAAIAADYLSKSGKVAILDIDLHHGNGTQSIFYNRSDVYYVSIHADPKHKFPYSSGFSNEKGSGKGLGFNKNYPMPIGTDNKAYLKVLLYALEDIKKFNPKYLVISAGFDTYEKDPIGAFKLTIPFYKTMGEEIAKLKLPTLLIQEGGYNVTDLGTIAVNFHEGLSVN